MSSTVDATAIFENINTERAKLGFPPISSLHPFALPDEPHWRGALVQTFDSMYPCSMEVYLEMYLDHGSYEVFTSALECGAVLARRQEVNGALLTEARLPSGRVLWSCRHARVTLASSRVISP